jgi:hypothetical protein
VLINNFNDHWFLLRHDIASIEINALENIAWSAKAKRPAAGFRPVSPYHEYEILLITPRLVIRAASSSARADLSVNRFNVITSLAATMVRWSEVE